MRTEKHELLTNPRLATPSAWNSIPGCKNRKPRYETQAARNEGRRTSTGAQRRSGAQTEILSGIETVARSSVETAAQKLRKMITDRRTVQRTNKNRDLTADVGSRAKILQEELKTRHKTQSKEPHETYRGFNKNISDLEATHHKHKTKCKSDFFS
jgi:hypothetical protein